MPSQAFHRIYSRARSTLVTTARRLPSVDSRMTSPRAGPVTSPLRLLAANHGVQDPGGLVTGTFGRRSHAADRRIGNAGDFKILHAKHGHVAGNFEIQVLCHVAHRPGKAVIDGHDRQRLRSTADQIDQFRFDALDHRVVFIRAQNGMFRIARDGDNSCLASSTAKRQRSREPRRDDSRRRQNAGTPAPGNDPRRVLQSSVDR